MIIKPQKKHELRNKFDKYLTPYSLTQQLLDHIKLDKETSILEPCSSEEGAIVKVLRDNGYTNVKANIYVETNTETDLMNILNNSCDVIITNTPYGKCIIPFVNKMKQIARKKVIALYPISTLHSTIRYKELWNDNTYKLKEVLMFVRPPMLTNEVQANGKYNTGINAYGWFIWENNYQGEITLRLIDNSSFVNRKSD
jgi:hypothetical protein